MDVNATLAELRQALADYWDSAGDRRATEAAALTMAERLETMDAWLSRGGFLPAAWMHGRTTGRTPNMEA